MPSFYTIRFLSDPFLQLFFLISLHLWLSAPFLLQYHICLSTFSSFSPFSSSVFPFFISTSRLSLHSLYEVWFVLSSTWWILTSQFTFHMKFSCFIFCCSLHTSSLCCSRFYLFQHFFSCSFPHFSCFLHILRFLVLQLRIYV